MARASMRVAVAGTGGGPCRRGLAVSAPRRRRRAARPGA